MSCCLAGIKRWKKTCLSNYNFAFFYNFLYFFSLFCFWNSSLFKTNCNQKMKKKKGKTSQHVYLNLKTHAPLRKSKNFLIMQLWCVFMQFLFFPLLSFNLFISFMPVYAVAAAATALPLLFRKQAGWANFYKDAVIFTRFFFSFFMQFIPTQGFRKA